MSNGSKRVTRLPHAFQSSKARPRNASMPSTKRLATPATSTPIPSAFNSSARLQSPPAAAATARVVPQKAHGKPVAAWNTHFGTSFTNQGANIHTHTPPTNNAVTPATRARR